MRNQPHGWGNAPLSGRLGRTLPGLLVACFLLAACATVDSRIRGDRDYFASLPEDVQENLRLGQVEIGYTKRMVEIALGSPDRVSRRVTAEGEVEVWDYVRTRPSIGIGVGTGSYGRRGGVGGGVSVGTGGGREVQASVTFRNDEVVSVERPG